MQKPLINNRRLNDKWSAQTNELMIKKLQGVKPQINSKCPESFFFFKTHFKKTNSRLNKIEQFEVAKNNENLLRKLLDVSIERNSKMNKNQAPIFTFKKNFLTGNKKYNIIKIAQENQSMLKRLNERSSFYDVNKWEKDYQMNQYYKRNHCVFPSIDFKRSNSGLLNNTIKTNASPKQNLSTERRKYNNSYSHFDDFESNDKSNNYIQINEDSQRDLPKILYRTQVFLTNLGSCKIEFAVQLQSFTIKIESIYEKERVFGIIFDSRKSIEDIQKYYKRYEDMINQLEYDEKNDIVKFTNLIKKDLICRCIKLPPKANLTSSEKKRGDTISAYQDKEIKQEGVGLEKAIETKIKDDILMEINNKGNNDQVGNKKADEIEKEMNNDQSDMATEKEDNNKNDLKKNDAKDEDGNKEKEKELKCNEEIPQTENIMIENVNNNNKQDGSLEIISKEDNQSGQEVDQIKKGNEENKGIEEEIKINN